MTDKMNVLFILTDQHRADHLSCYGNEILKTPNIDSIAYEGIKFTNAFCANPICMPNRASIFTGLYPNMHGVRSNGINLPENIPTITETLQKQGWYTKSIGKLHFNFQEEPFRKDSFSAERISTWNDPKTSEEIRNRFKKPYYGFEDVEIILGHGDRCSGHYIDWLREKAPSYVESTKQKSENLFPLLFYASELPEDLYPTAYITERAISFLKKYSEGEYGEKPFFFFCSYPDPHHPVCPPDRYQNLYQLDDVELPLNYSDIENVKNHPFLGPIVKNPIRNAYHIERTETELKVREFIAKTYSSISMIDYSIGQILSGLEKFELADNTIVIFSSDHGDYMGDHGLILKGPSPFSGVLRVPLIWKVPRFGIVGEISNSLVSSVDIGPTLLNQLNIKSRHRLPEMQGIDMNPVMRNPTLKLRKNCIIEQDEEIFGMKIRLRHLVQEKYKITVYNNLRNYGDIFNRNKDPLELNNLWFTNEELRLRLIKELFYENLSIQSRYPKRVSTG